MSGRSLGQEVELRLERSFERDNVVEPNSRGLGEAVAAASAHIQASTGSMWPLDRGLARYVHSRISLMLGRIMRVEPLEEMDDLMERAEAEKIDGYARSDELEEGHRARRWPATSSSNIVLQMATIRQWPPALPDHVRFMSDEAKQERMHPFKVIPDAEPKAYPTSDALDESEPEPGPSHSSAPTKPRRPKTPTS